MRDTTAIAVDYTSRLLNLSPKERAVMFSEAEAYEGYKGGIEDLIDRADDER